MSKENTMNKTIFAVVLVALGLTLSATSTPADAAVRFCFKHNVDFIDSGQELATSCSSFNPARCEDDWKTNDAYAARGIRVKVEKQINSVYTQIWYNYTDDGDGGDGAGCTPALDPAGANTGWYKITLESRAKVKGNYIYSRNSSDELATNTFVTYISTDGVTGTYSFTGSSSSLILERFNVLSAASQAQWKVNLGLGLQWYYFRVLSTSGQSSYNGTSGVVSISWDPLAPDQSAHRKFVISHELGHAVLHDILGSGYAGNTAWNDDGQGLGNDPLCANGSHGVTSKEYLSGAGNEGFAHFYASAAFNNAGSNFNCYVHHWGRGTVNCASTGNDTAGYVEAFMNLECGAGTVVGRGVELDWWRAFWDVRTQGTPNLVSYSEMTSWLSGAGAWNNTNVYSILDAEANSVGGSLDAAWNAAEVDNGIAH